jgi:glucose-6-phosphate isomerase
VFLQITTDSKAEIAIPDRPFSYGGLIHAQAAGDASVLADHGMPVLQLNLTDETGGVQQLVRLLGEI